MTRVLMISLAACALLLSSCRNSASSVILSSLNRSAKLQFLCAEVELVGGNQFDAQVLPSAFCDGETVVDPEVLDPQFLGAVTQIQRGEVAVVNFTRGFIFNTSRTIPGVTAVTVDEQPTGIQISPFQPDYTYVTSFSAKSLQAIPTDALIQGSTELPTPEPQRFDEGPTDLALHESAQTVLNDDGQVTGFEPEYRYLYAAIPELGAVAQIQVTIDPVTGAQILGEPVLLPLATIGCPPDPVPPPDPNRPVSDGNDYNRICPQDFMGRNDPAARVIKTVTTTQPCSEGPSTGPRPIALTIDSGREQGSGSASGTGNDTDDVLLVADANQPVIHRFVLGPNGATSTPLLPPIVTGSPTSEIDVTPLVPASSAPDDQAATQRYLYAVSATDSSILVVNYTADPPGTAEENKKFGAVLPVLAGVSARANEENVESRDRVRFAFANVRAIEVVSPSYRLEDDPNGAGKRVPLQDICTSNDSDAFALAQSANNMRGVFLAVSLSDGTMFFLDIYDLNAPCRGGSGAIACTLAETGPDRLASIRRHRERFLFTPTTFISIDGSPSFQFNAAPGRLDEMEGTAQSSGGPGLQRINCPPTTSIDAQGMTLVRSSMNNVFGVPGSGADGLICASSQVWSSFSEGWDARWEGLIPNSEGGLGLFADTNLAGTEQGNWFQASDVPLCRVGVLGQQAPDAALVESYVGDRLVITGELPPSTRNEPSCNDFVDLLDDVEDRPVWFPILRAFNHELEIGESENTRYTLDEVRACFPQFTQYQIHTQDAYTVTGTESGFINRVIPGANEECVLDPSRPVDLPMGDDDFVDVDTYLAGRAFEGKQYINPLVSFQIGPFPPGLPDPVPDSTVALLSFSVSNQFGRLFLDTSAGSLSLPSSMLFAPQQDELYFVDLEAGIRRIVFSPLNIVQTFE